MTVDIVFRTNNPPLWTSDNNRLTKLEGDQNFYNIKIAIEELQADRPSPDEISAITTFGLSWVVSFDSGRQITVPVQVLQWRWRGFWVPFMALQTFDGFSVEGVGLFSVNISHTAGAVFDKDLEAGGSPVYNPIYIDGTAANASIIYDMGTYYGPKLADNISGTLWEFPAVRPFTVPVSGHIARLATAPSTADQTIPLFHGGTQIGTITFIIGATQGDVLITTPSDIGVNEMFSVRKPAALDATAAGLSLTFAFQRIV